MNDIDYKKYIKVLYYVPPVLILLFVLVYYVVNRNLVSQIKDSDINNQSEVITYTNNSAGVAKAFDNNDFVSANKILDEKLKENKSDLETLILKANTLAQEASLTFKEKELGDQAMVFADLALKIDPNSIEALTIKGYIYEIQQNYTTAHKYYSQALALDPNNSETLAQNGHAYDLEGNIKMALVLYEKAYKIDPNLEKVLVFYSRGLIQELQFDKAKAILNQILEVTSNKRVKAETYYTLGLLSERKTSNNFSENLYQKATESDPSFPLGYLGLGKEYFKKSLESKNESEAKTFLAKSFDNLQKCIKINPLQTSASFQIAMQFYTLGNKVVAEKMFENVLLNIPKDISLNAYQKLSLQNMTKSLLANIK